MVDLSAIHSITVSMHEGILLLAFIAVAVRFLVNIVPKIPVIGWSFSDEFMQKTARTSETVATIAAIGGTIGILASAATGTIMASVEGTLLETVVLNKVMISIFALVFWVDFLAIRLRFGEERIWNSRVLQFFYPLVALIGFSLVTVGGSIGGTLAGKESILDPMFNYFGIDKHTEWILSPISDFSKMIVNSPLQYLGNISSMLQIVVIINVIITVLVMIYLQVGNKSKRS